MSVDLSDYVDNLKSEVNPPGSDFFPDATDDDWLGQLQNGFWEARLDGFIATFEEEGGIITPVAVGGDDIDRELVQLVIFYAGYRVLRATLRNLQTNVRSKAGPVEFEVTQSANVMRDLLKEMQDKRAILLQRLSDLGIIPTYYFDGVSNRSDQVQQGNLYWTAGRSWTDSYEF